jgi:hypothetical protein
MIGMGKQAALLVVLMTLCACGGPGAAQPSPTTSVTPIGHATEAPGVALPTSPSNEACLSDLTGHPITLAVAGNDVVGHTPSGTDLPIYWPPGFRGVVTPDFKGVYTDTGALFATPGQDLSPFTNSGHWGPYSACALGQGIWVFGPHGP